MPCRARRMRSRNSGRISSSWHLPCLTIPRWAAKPTSSSSGRWRSIRSHQKSFSRWDGRNGPGRLRSRFTKRIETRMSHRLSSRATVERWIADAAAKELEIRKFLGDRAILTVPDWMQHYALRPIPEYLRGLGVTEEDDFTSPSRLNENCIRYVDSPSPKLGYFMRATAQDPRPLTVHEGIPGITFSFVFPGSTRIRSGGITTIRARTRASASTPRK